MVYTFIIGLVLLILGLKLLRDRIAFIKTGNRAIATVIEIEERETEVEDGLNIEKDKTYSQVFKFTTCNNEEIFFVRPDSYVEKIRALGDEVKVVYDRENPHNKILLTHLNIFGIPLLLVNVALLLLFISGTYFVSQFFFNSLH